MKIPFVIDNQQHKMDEVLSSILAQHQGKSLDIATAYFNVGGVSGKYGQKVVTIIKPTSNSVLFN